MLRDRSFVVSLVRVREALRRSLSVCRSSCSCVEERVSSWHSQDRQEPTTNCPLSLLPSHPASVLPFWTIWGAFPQAAMCFQSEANYSPPLVLFPAEKREAENGELSILYRLHFSHLSAVSTQPAWALWQTHYVFKCSLCLCECVCESMDRCVCI